MKDLAILEKKNIFLPTSKQTVSKIPKSDKLKPHGKWC